jgi:dephospho-CoA kinase
MKWIGLTGGIASGKSTVSKLLKAFGHPVVDADEIAKTMVQPGSAGLKAVASHFGAQVLETDGSLNRKKLGALVFANTVKLAELESILHPLIKAEAARQRGLLAAKNNPFAFYDVPLLFEKKMEAQFDLILLVSCQERLQRERMKARDGLTDSEISNRLSAQIPMSSKESKANYVIRNDSSLADLEIQVREFLRELQSVNQPS